MYRPVLDKEGCFIRLAITVLIFLALVMTGAALAENVADEGAVDNGTMDLVTIVEGSLFTADQSVAGTGFVDVYKNLAVMDPDDKSQVLTLKVLTSGTGSYNHSSYVYVQNNTALGSEGEFESDNHHITAKEDTSAVYAPMSFKFPGSFRAKTIKSLWKDQTYARNNPGLTTMDSLIDYAKTLKKESTTNMYSDDHNYGAYLDDTNSTTGTSMDINSQFDGSAHLGVTLADVRGGTNGTVKYLGGTVKSKADDNVLMDEDYKGSFNLTKKMAIVLQETTNYGYYEANYEGVYEDYPWLPCLCNTGWNDMVIHDTRYHSAKGFFDCATCWPPVPCKK